MKSKPIAVPVFFALFLCLLTANKADAVNYTLTLVAQGSGTIYRNPTNTSYPAGVTVTINGVANPGWYFANWTGDTNSSLNPLNVVMNSNMVVTGNFVAYPAYSLALATNGQGGIALSPPGGSYLSNTMVTATATAAAGWVFTGWSGAANSGVNPVSFAVNTSGTLTGTFAQLPAFDVEPVSVTNKAGSTVSFSAHAVGTGPVVYEWYFSGGSLAVATNTTLSLTNVGPGQAGTYWLVATNDYASATSQMASLTLTNSIGPTNVIILPTDASLRTAIAVGGWIGFGFNGTLTLTNTINITNNVVLDGSGVAATVSGGNAVRLFTIANGASLTVSNLTLANGYVTNTIADAGAIYNNGGNVTLIGCALTNNQVTGPLARGGAIFNDGGLVLLGQTTISSNAATGSSPGTGLGGAIYTTNGTLTILGCNVGNNMCQGLCNYYGGTGLAMGGAVYQASGSITIANSLFAMNQTLGGNGPGYFTGTEQPASSAYGGGLAVAGGVLTIDHSQFLENTARGGDAGYHGSGGSASGGAIYSAASLTAGDSTFFGNQTMSGNNTVVPSGASKGTDGFGGAIYNSGMATFNCCSVCSNYVQGGNAFGYGPEEGIANGGDGLGGGIFNASQFAATNCTIALNFSGGGGGGGQNINGTVLSLGITGNALGGGVFNNINATFVSMNLTIASNSCSSPSGFAYTNGIAAGFQIANTNGTLRVHNTLIAYSSTNSNAYGPITDDGYNICSDGSASLFSGSSYNYTDPQLAALGNYGGPTLCMALLATSPAIDNGDINGCPTTDQRGYVRPFGTGPDMGAYEYGSAASTVPYLNMSTTTTNVMLSFSAFPVGTYYLQWSTNLTAWANLSTNGPYAVSTFISQSVSKQGVKHCFFRLLVQ